MRVGGGVEAIIVATAAHDADRIVALRAEVAELQARLAGVAAVYLPVRDRAPVSIRLPAAVVGVIRDLTPSPGVKALWTGFAARLRGDPEAHLVEPPEPDPPEAA